jgi:hypothetical protein
MEARFFSNESGEHSREHGKRDAMRLCVMEATGVTDQYSRYKVEVGRNRRQASDEDCARQVAASRHQSSNCSACQQVSDRSCHLMYQVKTEACSNISRKAAGRQARQAERLGYKLSLTLNLNLSVFLNL